jgi:hypothetical protein
MKYAVPVSYTITGYLEVDADSMREARAAFKKLEIGAGVNSINIRDIKVNVSHDTIVRVRRP